MLPHPQKTLLDIEAARAIVLLQQQHEGNDDTGTTSIRPSGPTPCSASAGMAKANSEERKTKGRNQMIDNDPVPIGHNGATPEGDQTLTTPAASPKAHVLSLDSADIGDDRKLSMTKPLPPRLDLDLDSSPREETDNGSIALRLPTDHSPMRSTTIRQSGAKRSWSPIRAVGDKGPPSKVYIRDDKSKPSSSRQQLKACDYVDLSLDEPSDSDDVASEMILRQPGRSATDVVYQHQRSASATKTEVAHRSVGLHSLEMKFIDSIAQKLTGRPQIQFKAIAALAMERHAHHDDASYDNLPKAILRNVQEKMDPTDYMGAYTAAWEEWKKDGSMKQTPGTPPTKQPALTNPHSFHVSETKQALDNTTLNSAKKSPSEPPDRKLAGSKQAAHVACPPQSQSVAAPPRSAHMNRVDDSLKSTTNIRTASPPQKSYVSRPRPNPPNSNSAIPLQNTMRNYAPISPRPPAMMNRPYMEETGPRFVAPLYYYGAPIYHHRFVTSEHYHGQHRLIPGPAPVGPQQAHGHRPRMNVNAHIEPPNQSLPPGQHLVPTNGRYATPLPSDKRAVPKPHGGPMIQSFQERLYTGMPPNEPSLQQQRSAPRAPSQTTSGQVSQATTHRAAVASVTPPPNAHIIGATPSLSVTTSSPRAAQRNGTTKSAMQLALRFGFALCLNHLRQRQRQSSTSRNPHSGGVTTTVDSMEFILEKAERELKAMMPAECDELWDEIEEFTDHGSV
jgi:hypothetical protein